MNSVHPDIDRMMTSILRMPPAAVDPCAGCEVKATCDLITCPEIGPEDIQAPEGARE